MMTSKITWIILSQLKKVWVRVVAFACLAATTVVVARIAGSFVPSAWTGFVGADAVDQLLEIMASSMLAVTTFSLSVAVSAFAAAAQSTTPRAITLLQQDPTTQNVLSTFLGAFIFSLVALLALKGGFYSETGAVVLFAATALVVLLVILAFLRWIAHLMTFGRLADTLDRVEAATADAIALRQSNPCLGGECSDAARPKSAKPIHAKRAGYVQHIDMRSLSNCAERADARIWIASPPGNYVHEKSVLAFYDCELDEKSEKAVRSAFSCAKERDFDQDPLFGVTVLSEIASRALSPAVNDPGTAIDVIARLVRVLSVWRKECVSEPSFKRVYVPPIEGDDLLQDAFAAISRDGASIREVHLGVQKALAALAEIAPDTFAHAASQASQQALMRAERSQLMDFELQEIAALAKKLKAHPTQSA